MLVVKYHQRDVILHEHSHPELFSSFVLPAGTVVNDALKDGEFSYNGILYDVGNISLQPDGYHISALADRAETRLQQVVVAGHGKPGTNRLHHFPPFIPLFFQQPYSWHCYVQPYVVVFNTLYQPISQQASPADHGPPPRGC